MVLVLLVVRNRVLIDRSLTGRVLMQTVLFIVSVVVVIAGALYML